MQCKIPKILTNRTQGSEILHLERCHEDELHRQTTNLSNQVSVTNSTHASQPNPTTQHFIQCLSSSSLYPYQESMYCLTIHAGVKVPQTEFFKNVTVN